MCGLFLTDPEARSVFEEARSLEVLTPGLGGYLNLGSPERQSRVNTTPLHNIEIPFLES